MTKADLRSGMIITCRNGNRYMVLTNATPTYGESALFAISSGNYNWIDLGSYNGDLTYSDSEWDIVRIEKFDKQCYINRFFHGSDVKKTHIIWTRPEKKKKYTYSELKEILGEEFEIIKE